MARTLIVNHVRRSPETGEVVNLAGTDSRWPWSLAAQDVVNALRTGLYRVRLYQQGERIDVSFHVTAGITRLAAMSRTGQDLFSDLTLVDFSRTAQDT